MEERAVFILAVRQDIVCRNGDGTDLLFLPGEFAYLIRFKMSFIKELLFPLAEGNGIGHQDQGFSRKKIHDSDSDNGFAGTAGEDNDAASALASENACDFKLNESAMQISYKSRPLDLTNAEYGILSYMIKKQGMVVSREDLIHNVSAINEDASNKSIDVMVGRIRNKLGDKSLIESIRGIGYKLVK